MSTSPPDSVTPPPEARKNLIFQDLFEQRFLSNIAANLLPCAGRALFDVLLAARAVEAAAFPAHGFNFGREGFRVGAPRTGVRAAFKKDDGSDPRPSFNE
jgi:hypothetical protein